MMTKMVIKNTQNADSRTANDELTKETLHEATVIHRADVQQLMGIVGEMIIERGDDHDFTKIIYFDEFAEEVLKPHTNDEFINAHWYQTHIFEERHHLNANCPLDVNLIDVLELICDCIVAGKGRAGRVTPAYLKLKDPTILERAYWNTVKMLDDIVEVKKEDRYG
ncbi:hypothetical protein [Methanobrevibacter sp.]|uniref:hypothetical protein n=1 Tax=Methanobrevibacter sp. TaxID=66852 RepID=UPI003864A533